jgi:hypothetical protein
MIFFLDAVATLAAFIAAWLWFQASNRQLRRVSKHEELDALDINRIVVAYNRSQLFNGRAALATAVSALAVALRFLVHLVGLG